MVLRAIIPIFIKLDNKFHEINEFCPSQLNLTKSLSSPLRIMSPDLKPRCTNMVMRTLFSSKSNHPSIQILAHEILPFFNIVLAAFTSMIAKNSLGGPSHTNPRTAVRTDSPFLASYPAHSTTQAS